MQMKETKNVIKATHLTYAFAKIYKTKYFKLSQVK